MRAIPDRDPSELPGEAETVAPHDRPSLGPDQEVNEGQPQLRPSAPLHDNGVLVQGQEKRRIDGHGADARDIGYRLGDEAGLHGAGFDELQRVTDVLPIDQLGPEPLPESRRLERLPRRAPIGRMRRVRDGDAADLGAGEVAEASYGHAGLHRRRQHDSPLGIERSALRDHDSSGPKVVHEALVRGEEDVRGRAVLDLLGERAGGAQDYSDPGAGGLLEERDGLLQREGQIRGAVDQERLRSGAGGGGRHPGDQEQREGDSSHGHQRRAWRSHRARRCWIHVSAQFTRKVIASRMTDSAIAISKLPLLVSSTVAVVSTRVDPLILPPTMSEAPTSEITPPKPAITAASIGSRASRSRVQTICASVTPITMGAAITNCASTMAVGV